MHSLVPRLSHVLQCFTRKKITCNVEKHGTRLHRQASTGIPTLIAKQSVMYMYDNVVTQAYVYLEEARYVGSIIG